MSGQSSIGRGYLVRFKKHDGVARGIILDDPDGAAEIRIHDIDHYGLPRLGHVHAELRSAYDIVEVLTKNHRWAQMLKYSSSVRVCNPQVAWNLDAIEDLIEEFGLMEEPSDDKYVYMARLLEIAENDRWISTAEYYNMRNVIARELA